MGVCLLSAGVCVPELIWFWYEMNNVMTYLLCAKTKVQRRESRETTKRQLAR